MTYRNESFSMDLKNGVGTTTNSRNSSFTTKLGQEIKLSQGRWEVALQAITFDRYFDTMNIGDYSPFIQFQFYRGSNIICTTHQVRFEKYSSFLHHQEFIDYIYSKFSRIELDYMQDQTGDKDVIHLKDVLNIQFDTPSGKFKFLRENNYHNITKVKLKFEVDYGRKPQIAEILGLWASYAERFRIVSFTIYRDDRWTLMPIPSELLKPVAYMKVMCDIAGMVMGYDNSSGYLGIFPLAAWLHKYDSPDINISFKNLHYIPVNTSSFNEITIGLVKAFTDTREELFIHPRASATSVTLSFRRV
jgi:hypothetical protein